MNEQESKKIARKFKLTADDVAALVAAGLDTPYKIATANPENLPSGLAEKLTRWHPEKS